MTQPIYETQKFEVKSDSVDFTDDYIDSHYDYETCKVITTPLGVQVKPVKRKFIFRTTRHVPRVGLMMVGIGGNNGSTVTGGIIANRMRLKWNTKEGEKTSNYFGSVTQATTTFLGIDENNKQVYVSLNSLLPMLNPNYLIIDGWDINSAPLDEAMERSRVFHYNLQKQLKPYLKSIYPRKSIYYPDFIAANQYDRADNILPGKRANMSHVEQIRKDIRNFKSERNLDKVIVLWTANTERFCDVTPGVHDTEENLMCAIQNEHPEIAPSQIFGVASILEGCSYINGSPQNTFVPGLVAMAKAHGVFIAGDDLKSGQTKVKSVLVDFLVSSGLKPESIVSYNHLGNNDGKNLSAPKQFRSKEISKSNVVDDMVASNGVLFKKHEKPDHTVVIKYVPHVQDSKRAMDEYMSTIFMNGSNTLVLHNTCEDSLLASPIIIDLVVLCELFERIQWKLADTNDQFQPLGSVLSILSFFLKAPLVPDDSPLVNAFFKQKACIENILRACRGLPPINDMLLEFKTCGVKKL